MSRLYHYCPVESLKAILEHDTLRLSDLRKSNDNSEIRFLYDCYKKEYCVKNKKSFPHDFEYFVKEQLDNAVFLGNCLSRESDSLHMWNCYGDKGVALGFDEEILREWTSHICFNDTFEPVAKVGEIKYFNSENITEYFAKDVELKYKDDYSDFAKLYKESPFIKSDFFKIEKELRIVVSLVIDDIKGKTLSLINYNNEPTQNCKFKSKENEYFQHVLICDIPFPKNMLKNITIGPNSNLTLNDVREILYVNGFDAENIEITKSKGSYR